MEQGETFQRPILDLWWKLRQFSSSPPFGSPYISAQNWNLENKRLVLINSYNRLCKLNDTVAMSSTTWSRVW